MFAIVQAFMCYLRQWLHISNFPHAAKLVFIIELADQLLRRVRLQVTLKAFVDTDT